MNERILTGRGILNNILVAMNEGTDETNAHESTAEIFRDYFDGKVTDEEVIKLANPSFWSPYEDGDADAAEEFAVTLPGYEENGPMAVGVTFLTLEGRGDFLVFRGDNGNGDFYFVFRRI